MNRFKRRLVVLALAVGLMVGVFVASPDLAVGGECECSPGYNYSYDLQDCAASGSNCSVCVCPPTKENKN